ncbi:MAG: hypothetical protein R6V21_11900, partial [Pelovirga sp.]
MKLLMRLLIVTLLTLIFVNSALASRIEISSPGQQAIPLALNRILPITTAQPEIAAEFDRVLEDDLEFSGLFRFIDPASFMRDAESPGLQRSDVNFPQWRVL